MNTGTGWRPGSYAGPGEAATGRAHFAGAGAGGPQAPAPTGFQSMYHDPNAPAPAGAPTDPNQPGHPTSWGSAGATFPQSQGAAGQMPAGNPSGASGAPGEGFGPGFGEQYGKSHVGQYDQPTALETFAQQQMTGNNPYYQRLQQQGDAAINQQMAARGHYNSGGALSALGNYNGALGAAQFQDMGNLLGSAGSMGLQREGQGQSVANSVQSQQQQRTGQQFGELSDIAHLGAGNVGGFYGQGAQSSGDAAMSGINAGANSAALTGQGQSALPNMGMQAFNAYLARK